MKHLILSFLCPFLICTVMAQTGANENNYGKLMYLGYDGGHYAINLSNKQNCGVDFYVAWLGFDTTIFVSGSSTETIQLPGPAMGNSKIQARALNRCGSSGGDLGQLEITTPSALPVTFVSVTAPRISDTEFMATWEVSNERKSKQYNIQHSVDGIHWKTITILWPDQRPKYSVEVNLANAKR